MELCLDGNFEALCGIFNGLDMYSKLLNDEIIKLSKSREVLPSRKCFIPTKDKSTIKKDKSTIKKTEFFSKQIENAIEVANSTFGVKTEENSEKFNIKSIKTKEKMEMEEVKDSKQKVALDSICRFNCISPISMDSKSNFTDLREKLRIFKTQYKSQLSIFERKSQVYDEKIKKSKLRFISRLNDHCLGEKQGGLKGHTAIPLNNEFGEKLIFIRSFTGSQGQSIESLFSLTEYLREKLDPEFNDDIKSLVYLCESQKGNSLDIKKLFYYICLIDHIKKVYENGKGILQNYVILNSEIKREFEILLEKSNFPFNLKSAEKREKLILYISSEKSKIPVQSTYSSFKKFGPKMRIQLESYFWEILLSSCNIHISRCLHTSLLTPILQKVTNHQELKVEDLKDLAILYRKLFGHSDPLVAIVRTAEISEF